MLVKSIATIMLAGAVAAASLTPALAAMRHMHGARMAGACGSPTMRCIADCDQFHWCQVYVCTNGKSTPIPFWRCFEPSGLCVSPHC